VRERRQVGLGLTGDNGGEECVGGSQLTSLVFIYNQHSVFNIGGVQMHIKLA
jgi:hypothetical protein